MRTFEKFVKGEGSSVDLAILDRIQDGLQNGRCLCGLGDSAGWVIMSSMRHFPDEYEAHARGECELCGLHPARPATTAEETLGNA